VKEGLSLHDNFIVTSLIFITGLALVPRYVAGDALLVVTSVALEHGLIIAPNVNLARLALCRQL